MISIIVPVWNGASFVAIFLQQIAQTKATNIEVIFVDDASTDKTVAIINEERLKYSFDIRLITHTENKGVSVARNNGIEAALGTWIYFVDIDDRIDKEIFSIISPHLTDQQELIFFNFKKCFTEYVPEKIEIFSSDYVGDVSSKKVIRSILQGKEEAYVWRMIVRKEVLTNNNLKFDEGLPLFEDALFLLRVLNHVSSVSFMPDILYSYFIRPASAIHRYNSNVALFPNYLEQTISSLQEADATDTLVYSYRHIYWAALRTGQFAPDYATVRRIFEDYADRIHFAQIIIFQKTTHLKGISIALSLLKVSPKLFYRYSQKYRG